MLKRVTNVLSPYLDKRVLIMFNLGFSSGLPLLLIFSSLSLWLREAGVERSSVTYFSWAALGFSFKFIWAPLVDKLPIPLLTKMFGRRKSWLLCSQSMVAISIMGMGLVDPAADKSNLVFMAIAAVSLGFSAATQDIVIDAFRIECAEAKFQGILSSVYIAGYRVAMIVSGAGALYLAQYFGSTSSIYHYQAWQKTYIIMGLFMLVGITTALFSKEPELKEQQGHSLKEYLHFFIMFMLIVSCFVFCFVNVVYYLDKLRPLLSSLITNKVLYEFIMGAMRLSISIGASGLFAYIIAKLNIFNTAMAKDGYINPISNFFERYGRSLAWLLLSLVGLYRISDIVLGVISNVFYQDLGFTKVEIANIVKTFGLIMSLLGGFLGGALTTRFGVIRILLWGAILSAGTNLLFMLLAKMGHNLPMLYLVISADNLAAGLASAAFVAFLSSLTDVSFTAVQYAIFTSLMTLFPKVLGGYSGSMVDVMGYSWFFAVTALLGLPVIFIVWLCGKKFKLNED